MNIIELAKENCPYHSEEMRGAYYDGFVRAAALVRAEALAEPELNFNCKSVQARLATVWGYVKAEAVKQEPIDDELKAKLDAFSDLKTILFEPERWTVSEHATYFGFFCWGWKYAKKPYAAPVQPMKREPVATEHPLVAYAEIYEQIARSGSSGKVSALAVATDIRQNMIPLTAANVDLSVLRPRNWTREMSDAWHRAIPNLEKAFDDLIAAFKEKNK